MIQLTDKLAVTADSRCYMLGNINGNRASKREQACSKAPKLVRVSYYSTMAQVVRGAVPVVGRHSRVGQQKILLHAIKRGFF